MKTKLLVSAMMLAGSLVTSSALADEGAIEGTLVKADDKSLTIKTGKGEEKTFAITEKTKKRAGSQVPGALSPGVTVEVYPSKDGKTAEMIELMKK